MKILVCVKQVPDMASSVTINAEGVWYVDEGLAFRLNEYDEYAVEEAVQLRSSWVGNRISPFCPSVRAGSKKPCAGQWPWERTGVSTSWMMSTTRKTPTK